MNLRYKKKGFTLIELIISIVLIAIIAGIGIPLLFEVSNAWVLASQRNDMAESARVAIDRMTREIRMIKDQVSVISASNTAIEFIDSSNNTISFSLSADTLERTLEGTTNDLVDNVSSLSFTYYDSAGATIATPIVSPDATDIRAVEVTLTLSLGPTSYSVREKVYPRRL